MNYQLYLPAGQKRKKILVRFRSGNVKNYLLNNGFEKNFSTIFFLNF